MTHADITRIVDAHLDRAQADSTRRFVSDVLTDAPDLDIDALDAFLQQNAAEWEDARQRAHGIVTRALHGAEEREDQ